MKNKILKNIFYLFCIQGMNYIIPLITLPYLVKILGPKGYGSFGFSIAVIQYFMLLTDYGFNLSATQQIARAKYSKDINIIFWNTLSCKFVLSIISLFVLYILIIFVSEIRSYSLILWCGFGTVLGNVIFPIWLFQGKEELGASSIINIISRLISVPLIFYFVKNQNDAWIPALINSFVSILAGVMAIFLIFKKKWISKPEISISKIFFQLTNGWHLFLSKAAVNLYTTSITVILGFIAGPVPVGYFVAADKLRLAVQGLIGPISQAVYPRVNSLYITNRPKAFYYIHNLLVVFLIFGAILTVILYLLSPFIIKLLYGDIYAPSILVLQILSVCPLLISISTVLGVHTMIVLNMKKSFSNILIIAGVFNTCLLFPLSLLYSEYGAALTIVTTETFVSLTMFLFLKRKKVPIFYLYGDRNEV